MTKTTKAAGATRSMLNPAKVATKQGAQPQAPRSPDRDDLTTHDLPRVHKTDAIIAMLRRPDGASIDELMLATGWQRHSVRGALAGAVKKKLGVAVTSQEVDGARRYRAPEAVA